MRKYMVYFDDRENVFKECVPATNEKSAKEYFEGNGEIVAVKDITDDFKISLEQVEKALRYAGFGKIEVDLITRCLKINDICE